MIINRRFLNKIIIILICVFSGLITQIGAVELIILQENATSLSVRINIDADLDWHRIENYPDKISSLAFGESYLTYLNQNLEIPYYQWLIALPNPNKTPVTVTNAIFETIKPQKSLSAEDLTALGKYPLSQITETGYMREVPCGVLEVYPLRPGDRPDELKILREIEITIQYSSAGVQSTYQPQIAKSAYLNAFINSSSATQWRQPRPLALSKIRTYPAGKWFRITVKKDGIYTLTLNDLKSAGLTEMSIDIDRIFLYSNSTGGRQLDATIGAAVPENLVENARSLRGNDDQNFTTVDTILFYGRASSGLAVDSKNALIFDRNPYSLVNYYWLLIADSPGSPKIMATTTSLSTTPEFTISESEHLEIYENELVNFLRSGLDWYGNKFSQSGASVTVPLTLPQTKTNYPTTLTLATRGATDEVTHYFKLFLTNSTTPIASWSTGNFAKSEQKLSTALSSGINILRISYTSTSSSASAHLDYVKCIYTKDLSSFIEPQVFWSPLQSGIAEYQISNLGFTNPVILDVTDWSAVNFQQFNQSQNSISFRATTQSNQRRQYYLSAPSFFNQPEKIELIADPQWNTLRNVNNAFDYIIITDEQFLPAARNIATLYSQEVAPEDRLKTIVVTQKQILREFNADITDPHAIRFFLKYAYENWATAPSYVLLLGDGTFDYRAIESSTGNYVMTYQVEPSVVDYTGFSSYASDARFAYIKGTDQIMDIAIGRVPVRTAAQAQDYYEKLKKYLTEPIYGEWRSRITLVADDPERPYSNETGHIENTENTLARLIPKSLMTDKLYLLEYPEVQDETSYGVKKPSATVALLNQLKRGTILINYIGHGSSTAWAQEYILKMERDISLIETGIKLPLWIAGTCSWGQFDDINATCMPEALINKTGEGGIAILAPTRPTYGHHNVPFISSFLQRLFTGGNINRVRLGDAIMMIYNGINSNTEKFMLFGDPALYLAFPYQKAVFDKLPSDTLAALQKAIVTGQVENPEPTFEGSGIINVFDSDQYVTRYYLDANKQTQSLSYTLPGEVIFRGNLKIINNSYASRFTIPKDLSYKNLYGRIKIYGWDSNSGSDLVGCYDSLKFIGSIQHQDTIGPQIKINFEGMNFKSGDVIPVNANLVVSIQDPLGVNIAGKLGHDITFTFDGDDNLTYKMTEDFVYDIDSDSSGAIVTHLPELSAGVHQITIKAWDNANNYSIATSEFTLASSEKLSLEKVVNFPNPFNRETDFVFYLTQPGQVKISIYTIRGLRIKTVTDHTILSPGFHQISWDGYDDFGDEIGRGIYLYKIQVNSPDSNQKDTYIGKMVKS